MENVTGYRYATDKKGKYWIIKLSALKEEPAYHNVPGYENEFVSDDCICESITEIETGQEEKSMVLYGALGRQIEYTKGEKIGGGLVWYCHSKEDLYKNYLCFSKKGNTYKPSFLADKMDYMITEVYKRTYEEVATEMCISADALRNRIAKLKERLGEKEDDDLLYPILAALKRMGKNKQMGDDSNVDK